MTPDLPTYLSFCAFLVGCGATLQWVVCSHIVDKLRFELTESAHLMTRAEAACTKLAKEYEVLKHRCFHYEIEIKRNRVTLAKFHRVRGVDGKWARRV